jgi:hypothetical protein
MTGYLIGDDSTMQKPEGKKMEGLGVHHSTTQDKHLPDQSLVESLCVLLGRRCFLAPQLYRQHVRKLQPTFREEIRPDWSCQLLYRICSNDNIFSGHLNHDSLVSFGEMQGLYLESGAVPIPQNTAYLKPLFFAERFSKVLSSNL